DNLRAIEFLGQFDELHIDFADLRIIIFHKLDVNTGHFLDPLQNVQTAAPAIPLQSVRRVGHLLQLAEDEVRDDESAIEESRFADIRNSPVDHDARVEYLVRLLWWTLTPEQAAHRGKVQHIALVRPHNKSDVGHEEEDEELDKRERIRVENRIREHVADQHCPGNAHN